MECSFDILHQPQHKIKAKVNEKEIISCSNIKFFFFVGNLHMHSVGLKSIISSSTLLQ